MISSESLTPVEWDAIIAFGFFFHPWNPDSETLRLWMTVTAEAEGFTLKCPRMELRSAWRVLLFPIQMLYHILKASLCSLLPSRKKDLSKEVVLITGGGRGIGRHLAKEFAKQGAKKVESTFRAQTPPLCRKPCTLIVWPYHCGGSMLCKVYVKVRWSDGGSLIHTHAPLFWTHEENDSFICKLDYLTTSHN